MHEQQDMTTTAPETDSTNWSDDSPHTRRAIDDPAAMIARAACLTVGELLRTRAAVQPIDIAVTQDDRELTYAEFNARVNRLAHALAGRGLKRGERIAVLSENCIEYLECVYAAAKLGAIVCAQNWRLAPPELQHCIRLTTPHLLAASPRHADVLSNMDHGVAQPVIEFGSEYETMLRESSASEPEVAAHPEDGLLILYTSGTTGLPKGALISHRAQFARAFINTFEMGLDAGAAFVGWPPMYHMGCMDQAIATLSVGGKVAVVDGFDVERMVTLVEQERIWWLALLPGTVDRFCQEMKRRNAKPRGVALVGAMADLIPRAHIAELTRLLDAPFVNSFGSTETGIPPASAAQIPIGDTETDLRKRVSVHCDYRLVDEHDNDVPDGTIGELAFRGPTLFSGYWNAPETNAKDFRGGWFHTGDAFVRHPDGTLSFADRVKYMIKSGGENIYPAEIERVLLATPGVEEAVVVRREDAKWGEVPAAFVARTDESLTAETLLQRCRQELAGFKQPKELHFVDLEEFPRSTTGKVQRHEVERWLK